MKIVNGVLFADILQYAVVKRPGIYAYSSHAVPFWAYQAFPLSRCRSGPPPPYILATWKGQSFARFETKSPQAEPQTVASAFPRRNRPWKASVRFFLRPLPFFFFGQKLNIFRHKLVGICHRVGNKGTVVTAARTKRNGNIKAEGIPQSFCFLLFSASAEALHSLDFLPSTDIRFKNRAGFVCSPRLRQ